METRKIKAILAAIKYQNFSRAAEEFSYTPSALSHMTDSLEAELGIKILVRTRTGVSLTEEGKLILEKLNALVRAEDELRATAASINGSHENTLRIVAYSSIANYILPEIVKRFKKEKPNFKISITVGNGVADMLRKNVADIAFGSRHVFGDNEYFLITEDPYVAVVADGMFPGRRTIHREELYPYTYISTNDTLLKKYFNEDAFSEIIGVNTADYTSTLSLVKEGFGITVLPSLSTPKHLKGIRTVNLSPKLSRYIGCAYRNKTPTIEYFIKFLRENGFIKKD
jgi:DNA-binding transcriptional LysR family regulator